MVVAADGHSIALEAPHGVRSMVAKLNRGEPVLPPRSNTRRSAVTDELMSFLFRVGAVREKLS